MVPEDGIGDDSISGKTKKSRSYHHDYGKKTYREIMVLAKKGDKKAQQMKKLIEEGRRLSQQFPQRRGHQQ